MADSEGMCGIAGIVSLDGAPARVQELRRMLAAMIHRGPDDEGIFEHRERGVALGQRRLAVIDLDPRARCPMTNEDGSVVVTFNGEIYNFRELRAGLAARGHRFRTEGDAEILPLLWEERGPAMVEDLRGMFAFAVWDGRTGDLFLARDRLGKKPLLWATDGRTLAFASEIRPLARLPWVDTSADLEAIDAYLALQYVPAPMTAFRGIRKLPAGSRARIVGGRLAVEAWWRPDYEPKHDLTVDAACRRLRELLDEATRLRLVADVPLGAFLSGGIDSGAVVASMARQSSRPVKTYTLGFEESEWSELPQARLVARRFGCEHHEAVVRPDAVALLPRLVRHHGEPFADPSAIPTFLVAEHARRDVTVALGGDGGDESFAGYERYLADTLVRGWHHVPGALRRGIALPLARRLPHDPGRRSLLRRVRRFILAAESGGEGELARARSWLAWHLYFSEEQRASLWSPDVGAPPVTAVAERFARLFESASARHPLDVVLSVDLRSYLPDDLLVKMDVASMASSLEVRSPLLDHELVEWAARLPASFKLRGWTTKWLLKRAHRGVLPDEILSRPKQGFGVPLERWLREDLREMARDSLLGASARTISWFRRETIARMFDEHQASRADHSYRLWALLVLEEWMRQTTRADAE